MPVIKMIPCKKPLSLLLILCFLVLGSPFIYGQTETDEVKTGTRSGTLANGMRYLIKSKAAWQGQPVSMGFYIYAGSEMEVEGQTDMAHYLEHLPYAMLREEAAANPGPLLDALRTQKMPLQAATYLDHTDYYYWFDRVGSEIYTQGMTLMRNLIVGSFDPNPAVVANEHGSFYQEYIHRNGPAAYTKKYMLNSLTTRAPAIRPEDYYKHVAGFNWQKVSSFYNDWYQPNRAYLLLMGPITDFEELEADIEAYFGKLKANPTHEFDDPKTEYLQRPNQFVQLEMPKTDKTDKSETELYLYWRNPLTAKGDSEALRQKWMISLLYDLIEDHLRELPASYARNYKLGIDKAVELPALGLKLTCFTGREREPVQEVGAALRHLKDFGVTEADYEKHRQRIGDAIQRSDTSSLRAVFNSYDSRLQAGESLELDQLVLKREWLAGLNLEAVNSSLERFFKAGPQDIGILAPKDASILKISEAEFRSWLQQSEAERIATYEEHETHLIPDSILARMPDVASEVLDTDALGGRIVQLANGVRVVLYPREGAALKLHGFREVGAGNLDVQHQAKAYLVPEWIQKSGLGHLNPFELQSRLTDLGMIYGRALYVNHGECGIRLNAPAQHLEPLLQLAHLYLSRPHQDSAAFTYWQEEEFRLYKAPPVQREDFDLTVFSGKTRNEPNAGLTALERYEAVLQSNMTELKQLYQKLFQHPQEFLFLLSGDFTEAEVLPILETYLGNLPVSKEAVQHNTENLNSLPKGPLRKAFEIPGILPQNLILRIEYSYPTARDDWKAQIDLKLIHQMINSRLWELRFVKKRGLYVSAATVFTDLDLQVGSLSIHIPTVVGMEDTLIKDVEELIDGFKEHPLTEKELSDLKGRLYLNTILGKSTLDKGYRYHKWADIPPTPKEVEDYLTRITPDYIMQVLRDQLIPEHKSIFMGVSPKDSSQ